MHRLTELSLRRPWLTLSILLAITVGLGLGVPKVKQAFGFRVLIGEEHPAIQALDDLISEFSGGYPVLIAWECGVGQPCESVFDPVSLKMADQLSRELSAASPVVDVIGPSNASVFVPGEDGFRVARFVENSAVVGEASDLAERALEDPFWLGDLVSSDADLGVIVVQLADNEPETDLLFTDMLENTLEPFSERGFSYHVVGDAPDSVSAGRALAESTATLIPVLVVVIGILLYLMTGSWQHTVVTLVTMGLALLWTRGTLGWLGWPQDGMLQVLAPLVVIVGVCDAVHLLGRYSSERRRDSSQTVSAAILAATRDAGPACAITTFTTAAAFASFTASDLDTFVRFGVILPVGVLACLLLSFSLLPIAIVRFPGQDRSASANDRGWHPVMDTITATSLRRATPLLVASFSILVFFGYGWAVHLRADNDWMSSLGESSDVVQSKRLVEKALGRSQSLEVDIQLPSGTQIEDPETLATLVSFSESLSEVDALGEPESVLDLIKRLNRLLHSDSPEFEVIGESSSANAELLEMVGFDDPDTLGRWLNLDRSRLRISLSGREVSQSAREAVLPEVNRRIQEQLPEDWKVTLTGEVALQYDWIRDVQSTQLRSFPIAFGIVFLLVSIFLRSWKLGLAAMVPTLLPVVVVLGAMGWLGMSLDVARAMIAAVVIGIGVDDAIHLLAHYKVRREEGDTPQAAMSAALQHTGRAIVTTSIALALGFLTLMMSAWQTVATFGFFVALSILGALVATLLVLPALVFAFAPKGVSADESAAGALQSLTPAPAGPDGEE